MASAQSPEWFPNDAFPGLSWQYRQVVTFSYVNLTRDPVYFPTGAPGGRTMVNQVWGSTDDRAPWFPELAVLKDLQAPWVDTVPRIAQPGGTTYLLLMWDSGEGSQNFTRKINYVPIPLIDSHTRARMHEINPTVSFTLVPPKRAR